MNDTVTTQEYADQIGVSRRTVQRWIQQGLIFAVKIGREFKIPFDEQPPTFYQQQDTAASDVTAPPAIQQPDAAGFPTEDEPEEEEDFDPETPIFEDLLDLDEECRDPDEFAREDLRKAYATKAEALAYAGDIPVRTEVFKRCSDSFYQVAIVYP